MRWQIRLQNPRYFFQNNKKGCPTHSSDSLKAYIYILSLIQASNLYSKINGSWRKRPIHIRWIAIDACIKIFLITVKNIFNTAVQLHFHVV